MVSNKLYVQPLLEKDWGEITSILEHFAIVSGTRRSQNTAIIVTTMNKLKSQNIYVSIYYQSPNNSTWDLHGETYKGLSKR